MIFNLMQEAFDGELSGHYSGIILNACAKLCGLDPDNFGTWKTQAEGIVSVMEKEFPEYSNDSTP